MENTKCALCDSDNSVTIAEGEDYEYKSVLGTFKFQECKSCGHLYLNPRPTLSSASVLYPSTYYTVSNNTKNSWKNHLVSNVARIVMLNRIKRFVGLVPKNGCILEIGFGDGIVLGLIKQLRQDITVIGVDLAISKSTYSYLSNLGIQLRECAFESADLSSVSVDLIIMTQLIEHLWDLKSCINKISCVLKPNGYIVIATPNAQGYDRKLSKKGAWGGYYWPRHMNIFTPESLTKLFEQYNLRLVNFCSLVFPVGWIYSLKYTFERRNWKQLACLTNLSNPFLLAIFTIIDLFAILLRKQTSNMQLLFQKSSIS
ncbi:MAG: class I SAM-dependent methyltransferase [Candidatus Melainabacteria bacterium]|nr:class I SAM-dependent methyltransferase [Candidatus Melainabacteria bacterium]